MKEKNDSGKREDCIITPPKGFVPPEDSAEGKPFDLVCTFEPMADGKLYMTKLGDMDMAGGEKEPEEKTSKPDYGQYAQGIMGGMQPGAEGEAPA